MSVGSTVYVDDSFASVAKLNTAIRYARQGQSQLAINAFQDLVSNYGQKLVYLDDGSYISVTDYVRDWLLDMPAVKSGMYDQLFGLEARREIDAALENRDVATLIRVADRYFPSTAALKGLDQAAEWYFERGEFSAAARTWRLLLSHPLAAGRRPEFLFRAALAEHLADDASAATGLRDRLAKEFPESTGSVAGKDAKLLPVLDDLLARPAWEKVTLSADEWPAFGGGPSRSQLLASNAAIGARLWTLPFAETSVADSGAIPPTVSVVIRGSGSALPSGLNTLSSFPVLSNGALFVHLGNQILAVSTNAGTKLWASPAQPVDDPVTLQYQRIYGSNAYRPTSHDSVCVFGDQVFAVLPQAVSGRISSGPNGLPILPTRVACLRRDDGTEVWSRSSSDIKLEKEGALTFIGSPLVTRQGVFVMARKSSDTAFTQQYLVRLDRQTGEATWSCYLCSTSNNSTSYNAGAYNMPANVPVPALVDDVLYISTSQGADCAVDANAGRILWLRVTAVRPDVAASGAGGRGGAIRVISSSSLPRLDSWKLNPPLIVGDKMIATDSQVLRIYDRWNGRLLKAWRASDFIDDASRISGTPSIDVLAGVVGDKLIFSIKNAALCYRLDSLLADQPQPRTEWKAFPSPGTAGSPQGRPFLTTTGYYIPFTNALVHVNLQTGKFEQWDWPKNDNGEPGKPGNILVTSEQVIAVNEQEIIGYSKWDTAFDNRMADIKADPKNPAPYLALAEISFRTEHGDIARENMKKAVDLANAGAAPGGQSAADMLARLYQTNLAFAEQLLAKSDPETRDQSRFYYEQCKATARTPEQGVEWRMRLAELSRKQQIFDEAAGLYSDILTDPALRAAAYREPDGLQSAGASAERHLKDLIRDRGKAVFKPFEDKAAALTRRAASDHDAAALQQVIDGYPNTDAAVSAATTLAALQIDKQDWENARRVLSWLQPRVDGDAQAKAIADLATASLGLKKYRSAFAWAQRGQRLYPAFSWKDAGKTLSFADLKSRIGGLGGAAMEGRLPTLPRNADHTLVMDPAPLGHALPGTQLLVPVETDPALRPPNLLFVRQGNQLHIRDSATGEDLGPPVTLPRDADTVLLGATKDVAVLLQAGSAVGVDLKSHAAWTQTLNNAPSRPGAAAARSGPVSSIHVTVAGGQVLVVNGDIVVNGRAIGPAELTQIIDENGQTVVPGTSGADPETIRRSAFRILGNARFTTARLLNDNLYLLAGNQIDALSIKTGKPAWTGPAPLPDGNASCFVANEDLLVAQIDGPAGKGAVFCAFDAQTGKPAKELKLDNERVLWRALGDDGILYLVTDQAAAAYDMVSSQTRALWRRTDIGSRFAAAAILTLDGLVVVNDSNEVQCLSVDSGEPRWRADLKLTLTSTAASPAPLQSCLDGDLVIFHSNDGCVAFRSLPQKADPAPGLESPQVAWIATQNSLPPRQALQTSDSFVVEMFAGAANASRRVHFEFFDAAGGKLHVHTSALADSRANQDPLVRSWQIVDGGLALETVPSNATGANVAGSIYLWRAQPH